MTSTSTHTIPARQGRPHPEAAREIVIFLVTTALLMAVSTTVAVAEDVDVRRIEDASALGEAVMYLQAIFPLVAAAVARLFTTGSLGRPGWGFRTRRRPPCLGDRSRRVRPGGDRPRGPARPVRAGPAVRAAGPR